MKEQIIQACIVVLDTKIELLKKNADDLIKDAESDAKSSAGDKHETSRTMMQLEQEKLYGQINSLLDQKMDLEKLKHSAYGSRVGKGSLVKTNNGIFFISVALGKINLNEITFFAISPASPLGMLFTGKQAGEKAQLNSITYLIEKIE